MEAANFYRKRLREDQTIGSIQLMEEYAKHVIEINFCNNSPIDFYENSIKQLKRTHENVNKCIDWVNE